MSIQIIDNDNGTQTVIIDKGNNEFVSMLKDEYDRQQAEQSTPNLLGE
jgi:hypothetical protein